MILKPNPLLLSFANINRTFVILLIKYGCIYESSFATNSPIFELLYLLFLIVDDWLFPFAGVDDNETIRVFSSGGADPDGMQPGDLFVTIKVIY